MSFPYNQAESAEDIQKLQEAAAQIAIDRGYRGPNAAAYGFAIASMLVNSLFSDGFPETDPGTGLDFKRAQLRSVA